MVPFILRKFGSGKRKIILGVGGFTLKTFSRYTFLVFASTVTRALKKTKVLKVFNDPLICLIILFIFLFWRFDDNEFFYCFVPPKLLLLEIKVIE